MEYEVKCKDVDSDSFETIAGPFGSLERAHRSFLNCMVNCGVDEGLGVVRFRSVRGSVYVIAGVRRDD